MEIADAGEDHKALRRVARALLKAAEAGKIDAIREVGDRMDGKVAQALVGDDRSGPLMIVTGVVRHTDPKVIEHQPAEKTES